MTTSFEIETQEKLNWCWAAVAATVSRYFYPNQAVEQCSIARSVLNIDCCAAASGDCDEPAALETALDALNTTFPKSLTNQPLPGQLLPFAAVRGQIDSGRPVCVRIRWFGESGGHFVMISGYSVSESGEPWVDVADPYYQDSTVPYDRFVSAYLDAGAWTDTYLVGQP